MEQIRLDLIPDGSRPVCHASQYDDGRVIRINLTENGADYTLSNETVELHVRKGDGTAVTCAVAIESGKKYVDIVTTTQMCAVYGSNLAELRITKNGVIIGTLNFILEVERDPLDSGISSSSQIHDLQAQVDACVQHTFDTLGASGLPFDHTGTDLTSDNVEDAIKEVNEKIGGLPADVYTKEETDALLDEKADKTTLASDYYDKAEVDTALSGKADTSALGNYYTKSENDALLSAKADKSTTYTKSQVNGLLDDKADRSDLDDYYTSAQVDAALTAKADKDNVYTKAQVDSALSGKVDNSTLDNYYDKGHSYSSSEVNGLLDLKADKATTYTKTQVDSALALKANSADVYNKSAVDSLLNGKADKSTTYTKTEVDTALALKANSADVYTKTQTYSKTEVDNALALKANAADVYTKQETDNLIAGILPLKSFSATPIAPLTDGAENVPMKSLIVDIQPKQASGTPTPDNPLPISGSDEVVITHTYGDNITDTHTIALPSTVYGGEVDVVSGSGESNTNKILLDGENIKFTGVWGATSSGYAVYYALPDGSRLNGDMYCNKFVYSALGYANMPLYSFGGTSGASQTVTFILPDTVTNLAGANTWLASNNIELAYVLNTPTSITTTPTQIKTRGGTESIFADCGDVEGEYRQSIQGYVAEQLNGNRGLSKGPVEETKEEEPEEKPEER